MGLTNQLFLTLGLAGVALLLCLGLPRFKSRHLSQYALRLARQSFLRLSIILIVAALSILLAQDYGSEQLRKWSDNYMLPTALLFFMASEVVIGRLRKRKWRDTEIVLLMNEEGKAIGPCPRPLVHNGSKWLHAVVHLHVFDSHNRLLLQLRPKTKKIQPAKWDTAVGGHIAYGEMLDKALQREAYEEIGLQNFAAQLTKKYVWSSPIEQEYVFVFETKSDGPFHATNVGEVDELRFWSADEIANSLGKGVFTPNLEKELSDGLLDKLKHTTS